MPTFEDSVSDEPFGDKHIIFGHRESRKWFALIIRGTAGFASTRNTDRRRRVSGAARIKQSHPHGI